MVQVVTDLSMLRYLFNEIQSFFSFFFPELVVLYRGVITLNDFSVKFLHYHIVSSSRGISS